MKMTYGQFIKNADDDQKKQIEIENIQFILLNELSFMDYEANEYIKDSLYNIAEKLVNDKARKRGFNNMMSLEQYCIAYNKCL
ncbi:hypothetical protein [Gilliamella sp. wkB112]|uniref:hypothetical protein n=1 Tax=Gilliamella sp. wkB112 TaxID=3120257 RepID=UPI00080E0995|nr:hypothetical protein [Gilliamella apicola]OCG02261.1 hypothetical protein A9G12_11165 [Gilliamella apicola]